MPTLTPYRFSDRDALLAIFDANTPRFFAPSERGSFEEFLTHPLGDFRVLRDEVGAIIGCGGVQVANDGTASLVWGMIAPPQQGTGYGWWMALDRLSWIATMPNAKRVALDTSQETAGFYAKLGFRTLSIRPDGYGPGLHRHDMALEVDAAFRKRFGARRDSADPATERSHPSPERSHPSPERSHPSSESSFRASPS